MARLGTLNAALGILGCVALLDLGTSGALAATVGSPTAGAFAAPSASVAAAQEGGRAGSRQPRRAAQSPRGREAAPGSGRAAGRSDGRSSGLTPRLGGSLRPPEEGTDTTPSDEVGGLDGGLERGLSNPFGYPPERQQTVWFGLADGDSTKWISFREAAESLRFDAPRFRVFDTDNDGRMTFEEFRAYIISESAQGRTIIEPRAIRSSRKTPRRNAEQLRAAYDEDLDGAISRLELDQIINDYDKRDPTFDTAVLIGSLDVDGSGKLEIGELDRVANFVNPVRIDTSGGTKAAPGARTVLELFGAQIDQGDAQPPVIPGPVPPFRRLDINNDGFVDIEDLERLEGRSTTTVRLGSVLNTLDIDYDGRLSEAEFLAAMTPAGR